MTASLLFSLENPAARLAREMRPQCQTTTPSFVGPSRGTLRWRENLREIQALLSDEAFNNSFAAS